MEQLPILSLKNFNNGSRKLEHLNEKASELNEALTKTGFLLLTNHGIRKETIAALYDSATAFFQAPDWLKDKFLKPKDRVAYHGYSFAADPKAHKYREYFHWWPNNPECNLELGRVVEADAYALLKNYRDACRDLIAESQDLCHLLFDLLTRALGLSDPTFFERMHTGLGDTAVPNQTYLASIFYPPLGEEYEMPLNKPRMGAHTDWDTFTFLFLDPVGGLEGKTPEGNWIPTDPVVDDDGSLAILLIVGDFLEKWSGGLYQATKHRVLVPTGENRLKSRLSFPFFVIPDNSVDVGLLKANGDVDNDGESMKMEKTNVGEYYRDNALRVFNKAHGIET